MKTMKRLLALLLALALVFSLAACALPGRDDEDDDEEISTRRSRRGKETDEDEPASGKTGRERKKAAEEDTPEPTPEPAPEPTPEPTPEPAVEAPMPDFEAYGLDKNLIGPDRSYDYITITNGDPTQTTVGKLTVVGYKIFEGDEELPPLEGYEWRVVGVQIVFSDDAAWENGMRVGPCIEDYYNIVLHDDSSVTRDDGFTASTILWQGRTWEMIRLVEDEFTPWEDHACAYRFIAAFRVPVGYDGCVVGFYNRAREWGEGEYIYDVADGNTLFFRLK
ncbi:MAG: hypothetical protein K6G17_08645 [Oscillospiraceae bacterium]|nr:hypothetical protein [Oscillospiraceae bacterium]